MSREKCTSKLKLRWLAKRSQKYRNKIDKAYFKVRNEIIEYIKTFDVLEPPVFIRYLATCVGTSDVMTFLRIMEGVIEDAKKAKKDRDAKFAINFCRYAIFRIHLLSHFSLWWTTVYIRCNHCHRVNCMNFCYTDKICQYCGNIVLKNKETTNVK